MHDKSVLTDKKSTIHFVGIGGVSMSALAQALLAQGVAVRGSDMNCGVYAQRLSALGVDVMRGHSAENVDGASAVVRTSAIKDDNPEIIRARELGIPVFERTEAWGVLMENFENVICVSGTHGKTSTTAMTTCMALSANLDPEVMIGADMREIGGVLRIADSDLFIAEACEYCNSFLNFKPSVAVVLNIEEDHLDFFSGIDEIIDSFASFLRGVKPDGTIIINGDDKNAREALSRSGCAGITFGFSTDADVRAENIEYKNGFPSFDLIYKGEKLSDIRLAVMGEHNIKNALAASAAALAIGIGKADIAHALSGFTGVSRRMEYKGEFGGARIYDDYAHHPSEIETTLKAARKAYNGRIICVFQPHTYTRTAALKDDFAKALKLADKVVLADIFAAREKNENGIDSRIISDKIDGAEYISGFAEIADYLKKTIEENDLVITMGAGNIREVGEMLIKGE